MNLNEKLKKTSVLPTLAPLEILRLMAQEAEKNKQLGQREPKELAKVTLYLTSTTFSGYVLGLKEEPDGSYILFVEHDERDKGINIVYLPLWSIVAVKVHDIDQFLPVFTGGKIEAQTSGPGIVGLRKKISDESVRLRTVIQADIKLEVSWETLTQDEVSLLGLYELIDLVMPVIIDLISDEFRRISFKTIISAIRFQNAQEADIILDGNNLIIRANLRIRGEGRFSKEACEKAIASIL